ncbi:MAG: 50S ribosomal protein L10 [Bacteroidetes bacterium]|nr:MAG: 50S ribosomal protein L10 [Bacteroidota bacterium]
MNKTEKESIVNDLAEKIGKYEYVYLTDTSGLSANTVNNLRRELFKAGIQMQVAKNTLIKKAIEQSGKDYGVMLNALVGSSALFFSEDAKSPAKAIKDFRKKGTKPALKAAYIQSDIFMGDESLEALIAIKSKEEMIGEVITLLQSPAKTVISQLQSGGNKLAGIVKTLSEKSA